MFANKFGEHENVCCGLVKIIEGAVKSPIPLISVDVKASVVHAVAQVEVTQVYCNKEEMPIEAIYYFPVNPEGAVTHFQAELEGRVIKGTVKPQEEAREEYEKAVENKKTAFLGEETKADIFKVRVGFLKPGAQVKVIIGYVTEVKNEPGTNAIRFYIPTTIAPRYVSPSESDDEAKDIKEMKFAEVSPAPLSLKVAVSLQGGIKSIESPTHEVTVDKTGPIYQNGSWDKALVELAGETKDMDQDFVLNILPEEVHKPRLYSEKGANRSTAIMVHLIPSFKLDEQKTELIFVLDRSWSMDGVSMDLAKKALLLFLHSMPADCYFNVVGFGSTSEFLFPTSVKYADKSLKKAIAHAKDLEADLGGTEILGPLEKIYGQPGIDGYLRQLFILTDGEVSNTGSVLGIAQANANSARVFALGIGSGASHHLVEGVAKAGGGTSAFVTGTERMDIKVLNQLKNALQPSLTDIQLEWEGIARKASPVLNKEKTLLGYNKPVEGSSPEVETSGKKQSPKQIPPVYDGSQMLVFGLFKGEVPKSVKITAASPDGPLTIDVEISPSNELGQTGMLHRLAAIKLVRELELELAAVEFKGRYGASGARKEELKKEIVEIGVENGITSRYTSFVAIDEEDGGPCAESWVMETRNVPSQIAHGYAGQGGSGGTYRQLKSTARICSSGMATRQRLAGQGGSERICGRTITTARKSTGGMVPRKQLAAVVAARKSATCYYPGNVKLPKSEDEDSDADSPMEKSDDEDDSDSDNDRMDDSDESTPLLQLVSLQSFDGSFALNENISAVFGKSLEEMKEGASQLSLQEQVFATASAISYFVRKMSDEKDVWELIVIKARKWLAKEIQPEKVDDVISAATTFLGQ